MAALLSVCTKEEQCSVIWFLCSEGESGAAIHQRLSVQYGNSVLLQQCVYEWIEKLKKGHTNIMHDKGTTGKLMLTVFGIHMAQYWNIIRRGAQQ